MMVGLFVVRIKKWLKKHCKLTLVSKSIILYIYVQSCAQKSIVLCFVHHRRGEWIPAEELDYINEQRFHNDQPYLLIHPRRYEDEKAELQILRKQAKKDFLFQSAQYKKHLHKISEAGDLSTICDQVNRSATSGEQDEKDEINREIGQWFSDYLTDSGYYPHTDSVLIKQAIMHSFPNLGNTQEEGRLLTVYLKYL